MAGGKFQTWQKDKEKQTNGRAKHQVQEYNQKKKSTKADRGKLRFQVAYLEGRKNRLRACGPAKLKEIKPIGVRPPGQRGREPITNITV